MSVNISSDGSPTPRKHHPRFAIHEDLKLDTSPETLGMAGVKRPGSGLYEASLPMVTSRNGNQQQACIIAKVRCGKGVMKQIQCADESKKQKVPSNDSPGSLVDNLMSRLSEQTAVGIDSSSNGSVPITPATEMFVSTPSTDLDDTEVQRLKKELSDVKTQLQLANEEAHLHRITTASVEPAMCASSEGDYNYYKGEVNDQTISTLQDALNASTRPWAPQEDARSDMSVPTTDGLSYKGFAGRAIWGNGMAQGPVSHGSLPMEQPYSASGNWNNGNRPFYNAPTMAMSTQAYGPIQTQSRSTVGPPAYRRQNQFLNEPTHFPLDPAFRNGMSSNPPSRPGSAFEPRYNSQWAGYAPSIASNDGVGGLSPSVTPMPMGAMGMYNASQVMPYPSRPIGAIGTRLSPEAAEFSVESMAPTPWNTQVNDDAHLATSMANLGLGQPNHDSSAGNYVTPVEPMNYRRLLDRNMSCNWKYIVDKIICNNDQQASIFLQQKLKVGTAEQKYEIVDAIISQAYPLMINRFGNFLVQRCFEHGTPEQVIQIANAIRGNTLTLSMDAFGCHVIQKAFDAVPEEYKAIMVHELLRRIPETVIHRYACHVWQKLFELRWADSPPQIMKYVNEALRGMWHEVALGETGSLVVQNIFENCLEEDKRPCINEVLASIDVISHGQFGNWCIQHICEHGAANDRSRALEHILRFATEYSMDQYASKVIEKCLKIGGNEFLDRYLERVCEGRADRPRMPLIDIAGDQFGNYLIQYVLTNSSPHHREMVATHVRKHMVSLRGSKYGSRVAMLCCNPASATRPGPPTGMQLNRYNSHGSYRGGAYGGAYR